MKKMSDKERLDKINDKWGNYDTHTHKGFSELCYDFEWLLEQAEKVEKYEKALTFYADKNNYKNSAIHKDGGEIARKALKDCKD